MIGRRIAKHLLLVCLVLAAWPGHARMVHDFDCSFCHLSFTSDNIPLMTYNVCLNCHNPGFEGTTFTRSDGSNSNPITATFSAGDGSDAMGNNGAANAETSHFFAASTDDQPAAGASPPADWRFNVGWATGLVTCSRCHDPHASTSNPQLLKLGAGSADAMCLDCHRGWNQTGNHGRGSHPMVANYPALAAAQPDKFNALPDNFGTEGDISLVDDVKVSCTSCHGVHWVDSDAATADGKGQANANRLSAGDGKLLKFDGEGREDPAHSICTTCHNYLQHGRSSGLGCLVCHGGHEYDPDGSPNYFLLRKQVDLPLVPKTGAAGTVSLGYASYPPPVEQANGACLGCHDQPASHAADSSPCKKCHSHDIGFAHSDGNYGNSCLECHAGDHATNKIQANWVTIFGGGAHHARSESGPIDAYAECSLCHPTNVLTPHGNDCSLCHSGASPPRASFGSWNQTCQQGSCHPAYHAQASAVHDAEYETGCYNCHTNPGFNIPWPWDSSLPGFLASAAGCGKCHSVQPDQTPPVSSSDLRTAYIGDALITIWARDSWSVQSIFYRLDGGATRTYSGPITVAAPAEGSQSHSLEFWASDPAGNVESPNLKTFTVARDNEPPVTTSDVKPYYGGAATINLTATDDATSYGVKATYYVLDDPDGDPTPGVAAVIPEPASGSEQHTLYFWSVDHADNIEAQKSVSFTMIADGQEPTAFILDQTVTTYKDDGASGPRISYTIYIDGNYIDSFTKGDLGPGTTSWNCPQLAITAGGEVKIVVDAWFTSYTGTPAGNAPYTYTFNLPAGTVMLEASTWTGFPNLAWQPVEYEAGYGDFAYVSAPQGAIGNIVYVTASPDITPPLTTSNVVADTLYYGAQTFTLSASDPGGAGVAKTFWQLDGMNPNGWHDSTSVPVSAPALVADIEPHTLYYYSRDFSGNDEPVQSVSFSIQAVVEEETAVSLDQAVWYDTAPGATGPYVNYKVTLDGVLLPGGSFNAPVATNTSKTFNWLCPKTAVTGPGVIEIVVTAGFSSHGTVYGTNSPRTFTRTLPEGTKRLESKFWIGFPKMSYDLSAYDDWGDPYATVFIPAGKIDNIIYSTTIPDTTPPVTTSNVTSGNVYLNSQTFSLTSSDPGGTGTEFTKWQLDSTGGTWHTGSSVTVSPPASGSKAHTLYFYSIDYAGNQEVVKSVSFSVEALGTEKATLALDQSVWSEAIPSGSGPWVNYKIYLDGSIIANVYAVTANPVYVTTQTFSQAIPQKDITGAGQIDIEVTAGFSTPGEENSTNSPTDNPLVFSTTLPAGAKRLEAGYWTGLPKKTWEQNGYYYDVNPPHEEYPYSSVAMPTGVIGNITYASTGSDLNAPITTCNAVADTTYVGDQTFTLTPTDTGSGVESTWWQLDGGAWNIGTSIPVAAPASGTRSYTITWYSRDNGTNQEAQQSVTFEVSAN